MRTTYKHARIECLSHTQPNSSGDVGVGENELKRVLHARQRRNDEVTDKITAP